MEERAALIRAIEKVTRMMNENPIPLAETNVLYLPGGTVIVRDPKKRRPGRPPKGTVDMKRRRKVCARCQEEKPFTGFSKLAHGIGGVHSICKPCRRDAMRAKREKERAR